MAKGAGGLGEWDGVSRSLGLVAAALAGLVYLQVAQGFLGPSAPPPLDRAAVSRAEPTTKAAAPTDPYAVSHEGAIPLEEDYEVVLERPLFSPERRPAYAAAPAIRAARAPGLRGLKLTATARDGARRFALLQGASASEYFKVAPGEALRGWRLLEINGDEAVFEQVAGAAKNHYGAAKKPGARMIVDRDGVRPAGRGPAQ